ncbi:hypothetical protein [Streptomyces sp. NEAU-W12]|uniref:hypothetical protein n=1 Tax=Streptomyces sp. NEAU-W12 TaxID=2994668 RepID=UPI00224B81AB|nr:hypothetical protein [Streptomyces sp. NEAU-W12]MCX2928536.1 hypothetical protein [Streptomyces sp. NEAU-W12]
MRSGPPTARPRRVSGPPDEQPWQDLILQHVELDREEAILAHRSEAARERPLPGLLARLPEPERDEIISTEQFTRLTLSPAPGNPHRLVA